MTLTETHELNPEQMQSVLRLWNASYPEKLAHPSVSSLERYFSGLSRQTHVLLTDEQQQVAGWCCSFERDNGRWFAIIVCPEAQGKGYGTLLLHTLKKKEKQLAGWVIDHHRALKRDGSTYRSPLPFYLAKGFRTEEGTRLETDSISAVKIKWQKEPLT